MLESGRLASRPAARRAEPGHPTPARRRSRSTAGVPARRQGRPAAGHRVAIPTTGCWTGRTATIERIYLDYDGRAYLGVTIDNDPAEDLMRESGRYLFFFADEVEAVSG